MAYKLPPAPRRRASVGRVDLEDLHHQLRAARTAEARDEVWDQIRMAAIEGEIGDEDYRHLLSERRSADEAAYQPQRGGHPGPFGAPMAAPYYTHETAGVGALSHSLSRLPPMRPLPALPPAHRAHGLAGMDDGERDQRIRDREFGSVHRPRAGEGFKMCPCGYKNVAGAFSCAECGETLPQGRRPLGLPDRSREGTGALSLVGAFTKSSSPKKKAAPKRKKPAAKKSAKKAAPKKKSGAKKRPAAKKPVKRKPAAKKKAAPKRKPAKKSATKKKSGAKKRPAAKKRAAKKR